MSGRGQVKALLSVPMCLHHASVQCVLLWPSLNLGPRCMPYRYSPCGPGAVMAQPLGEYTKQSFMGHLGHLVSSNRGRGVGGGALKSRVYTQAKKGAG